MTMLFIMLFCLISIMQIDKFAEGGRAIRHMLPIVINQHSHFGKVMQINQAAGEDQKEHEPGYYAMHPPKLTKPR